MDTLDPSPSAAAAGKLPEKSTSSEPVNLDGTSIDRPAPEESDTCRICRAEGTPTEPLFYPCKCSGSIKFVHQDCLMEWLSHSQKKYCELCKTPFRFTKLYHPHMPKTLPTTVFIRKAIWHILVHFMTWLRAILVITVWFVCLPWAMRSAWQFLFWLADAGWSRDRFLAAARNNEALPFSSVNIGIAPLNATHHSPRIILPSPPGFIERFLEVTEKLPMFAFLKALFRGLIKPFYASTIPHLQDSPGVNGTDTLFLNHPNRSSLLSGVPFLVNATRWPTVNSVTIHVLEGFCITVGVVVAFILVFLIREWVVQQQPALDLAAAQDMNNALLQAGGQANEQQVNQDERQQEEDDRAYEEEWARAANANGSDQNTGASDNSGNPASTEQGSKLHLDDLRLQASQHPTAMSVMDLSLRFFMLVMEDEILASLSILHDMSSAEKDFLGERLYRIGIRNESAHLILDFRFDDEGLADWDSALDALLVDLRDKLRGRTSEDLRDRLRGRTTDRAEQEAASDRQEPTSAGDHGVIETSQTDTGSEPEAAGRAATIRREDSENGHGVHVSIQRGLTDTDSASFNHEMRASDDDLAERSSTSKSRDSDAPDSGNIAGSATSHSTNAPTTNRVQLPEHGLTESTVAQPTADEPIVETSTGMIGPNDEADHSGVLGALFHWFYGDVPPPTEAEAQGQADEDDDHIVEDINEEAPFIPFAGAMPMVADVPHGDPPPVDNQDAQAQDPEVAAAAAEAGIDVDQEAIDDAEDLEGILELIGMQGPVIQLFQNAIFSAVLITTSISIAVFMPYLWGKVILLCLATPRLFIQIPVLMSIQLANFVVDLFIAIASIVAYSIIWFYQQLFQSTVFEETATYTFDVMEQTWPRLQNIGTFIVNYVNVYSDKNELMDLSILSHHALGELKGRTTDVLATSLHLLSRGLQAISTHGLISACMHAFTHCKPMLQELPVAVSEYMRSLTQENVTEFFKSTHYMGKHELNFLLAYWSPADRALAVVAGYGFVAVLGAFYLAQLAPLTTARSWRQVENVIIEFLTQAGGVLKVIFIIGIEMIAFPLFCGFLLDLALLPLFEDASMITRLAFTMKAPWTSGFVHWFVGTCYMFHFALFVSMCRKIMRKGVLYFIRDPDDPTFHPVRDVLERSVAVQLRKIAFSAIVYGALIMICLGGVVWGLWCASDQVLPIRWSSTESSLEFPLDILFYSFLTPVVLRVARPSDVLHSMYEWWFHRCARVLRLSSFLFRDTSEDEQGHFVRQTWSAWILRKQPVVPEDSEQIEQTVQEVTFVPDGRYVQAPGSDQVRLPKGDPVFIPSDQEAFNQEQEHLKEVTNQTGFPAVANNSWSGNQDSRATVYIPPLFKIRIGLFVLAVWLFAAATGIITTILPLLLGRILIKSFMPEHYKVNDIYAFSLGLYILGSAVVAITRAPRLFPLIRSSFSAESTLIAITSRLAILRARATQALTLLYVYGTAAFVLPFLFAILVELYILLPVHVYFGPPGEQRHIVNLVQDWTLGFLYARIGARFLEWNGGAGARGVDILSRALQAVVRDGYWAPDARLATRYFILPFLIIFGCAALGPFLLANLFNAAFFKASDGIDDAAIKVKVIRLAYPVLLSVGVGMWVQVLLLKAVRKWKSVVRDEVYLIGERLHNFGESQKTRTARMEKEKSSGGERVLVEEREPVIPLTA